MKTQNYSLRSPPPPPPPEHPLVLAVAIVMWLVAEEGRGLAASCSLFFTKRADMATTYYYTPEKISLYCTIGAIVHTYSYTERWPLLCRTVTPIRVAFQPIAEARVLYVYEIQLFISSALPRPRPSLHALQAWKGKTFHTRQCQIVFSCLKHELISLNMSCIYDLYLTFVAAIGHFHADICEIWWTYL